MAGKEFNREAEIAHLTQVAERVARRTNTELVVDPYKRRNFAAGALSTSDHDHRSSVDKNVQSDVHRP